MANYPDGEPFAGGKTDVAWSEAYYDQDNGANPADWVLRSSLALRGRGVEGALKLCTATPTNFLFWGAGETTPVGAKMKGLFVGSFPAGIYMGTPVSHSFPSCIRTSAGVG